MRRWPNGSAWAHGDAARHQLRAQKAASAINGKIANDLAVNQLGLKRRKSKERPILDVFSGTVPLFSVWEKSQRVINQKRRCFCGLYGRRRPKRIRRCHDHAKQATELAFALRDWEEAERQYWDSMHGKPCCGSCDNCPLSP
ncbi:E2 domain-associated cysteine-rich protein [Pseudomonas aeruginosa]|uniref:E2 domain-associated cysteine-rich protein n=1 Tax=Pseudomonas aeruginosa TaxID=287 RepID=UPI003D15FBBC